MILTPNRSRAALAAILIAACTTTATAGSSYSNDATLLIRAAALRHHVPVDFALKVARAETGGKGGRCGLRGSHGEVGPLQILPSTARAMGYRRVSGATCEAQTDAGMAHLAYCYRHTHTQWMAAACHNQGVSVAAGKRVTASARRYANAVVGTASKTAQKATKVVRTVITYPVEAFTAPARLKRIVAPEITPAAIKPKKTRYKGNWVNAPK